MTHHDKDQSHEAGGLYSQIAQENEQVVDDLQAGEAGAAAAKADAAKSDGDKTDGAKTGGTTAEGASTGAQEKGTASRAWAADEGARDAHAGTGGDGTDGLPSGDAGEDLARQANEAVADARQKGAEAAAALREGVQHLAEDVAKMGGTAREFVQTYAREGVREAKAFEQAARARLDAHARTVCGKAKEGKEQVRGQLRERPGAVLAGVAALGFVAGLLVQPKKPKGKLPGRGNRWN